MAPAGGSFRGTQEHGVILDDDAGAITPASEAASLDALIPEFNGHAA